MGLNILQLLSSLQGQPQQQQGPVGTFPGPTGMGTPPAMPTQLPSGPAPPQPQAPDGTSTMLQQAMQRMANPMANTIPQMPQAPQQDSPHPLLRAILQSIGNAAQNFGYGAMTGTQQQSMQELEAKKAETMANLASTQAWHEGQLGLGQEKVGVAERRANTAEQIANTQAERVKAYEELGKQRNAITAAKSDWQKDIASGNLDNAIAKMAQQNRQFEESINQKQSIFEQSNSLKQEALDTGNLLKESAQDIMRTALAQKGTLGAAEVAQKLTDAGLGHFIQNMMGSVPGASDLLGTAAKSGMPGVAPPAGAPGTPSPQGAPPTPGAGGPPMPPSQVSPSRPTPQNKAAAKSGKTQASGQVAPEGTVVKMADGTTQVKRGGQWVTSNSQ